MKILYWVKDNVGVVVVAVLCFWLGGICKKSPRPTTGTTIIYHQDSLILNNIVKELEAVKELVWYKKPFVRRPKPETVRIWTVEGGETLSTNFWNLYYLSTEGNKVEVRTTNLNKIALMEFPRHGECFRLVASSTTVPYVEFWNPIHLNLYPFVFYDFRRINIGVGANLHWNRFNLYSEISQKDIRMGAKYYLWRK